MRARWSPCSSRANASTVATSSCSSALRASVGLGTTWRCIVEASHFIEPPRRYAMLRWAAAGATSVFPVEAIALASLASLMEQWTAPAGTEMDLADASLVALASDTGVTSIMTLDRRDFSRYRLAGGRSFEIL
jgi:predicted nucleic acid-binding protein